MLARKLLIFSGLCCVRASSMQVSSSAGVAAVDHHYFRPSGADVSGFPPPNAAANHRSPCPALNSLANHGYLPRDGKLLTPELVRNAVVTVFNLDESLAERLTQPLPQHFTLADLSVHGFIEHDASLVHDDTHFQRDPAQINTTLAGELLARSSKLNKHSMAAARRQREAQCKKENPEYEFPLKAQAAAYGESALLLLAMGDYDSETISVEHATSFLADEKIPDDFRCSEKPISTATALYLAAQIKLLASLGWGAAETQ
ncbi:hypothetical protein KRP22_013271 [Phytophthora ramorum]|uniref:Aromatic peroxygenase n=1 Tax=Phytophthora ramorum TaxID=164328 RepID=UPI0030A62C38|nr:Aromatic peroxygenase [Phytophthora ramorum]KAH7499453.1 Aromatic peroxygenase [Phytophthora ramorum]